MKFCKNCANYSEGLSVDGGTLLPGFAYADPARCKAAPGPFFVNVVTGEKTGGLPEYCSSMRDAINGKCGPAALLFTEK